MEQRIKNLTRRAFNKLCSQSILATTFIINGCSGLTRQDSEAKAAELCDASTAATEYEYIIVGSGAGGGPLAANLARKGHKVLLMEAGGNDEDYNYQVPVFHTLSTEDATLRWDFFVRH